VRDLEWLDERSFAVDGVTFHLRIADRFPSTRDAFLLVKHRHMVERYTALLRRLEPRRLVELGILEGGSTAFAALVAAPDRMLAVDLKPEPTGALEELIEARGIRDRVRTAYGVDQGDRERLHGLIDTEMGDAPLDLVVDDASHLLDATRTSFEVLFPRLRPGGVFVIEDWSADHHLDAIVEARLREEPGARAALEHMIREGMQPALPLTVMLFELVLASAYHRDVVEDVFVSDDWAYVVRGPARVDRDGFALADLYSPRAATLLPAPR
jgi:predicted O-methyltransferase YrrM